MDYRTFQTEVGAWSRRNFGETSPRIDGVQPAHRPLLGIVEEFGELEEAVALRRIEDIEDAGADIMVYMADYCDRTGIDLAELLEGSTALSMSDPLCRTTLKSLGRLAHARLKTEQRIRHTEDHETTTKDALRVLVGVVRVTLSSHGLVLEDAVANTWERVSKRDWKANPSTGD